MFDYPAEERPLESNIHSSLFAFDPFVAQNFVSLADEQFSAARAFHQPEVTVWFVHNK
jgi:hypothetical protein